MEVGEIKMSFVILMFIVVIISIIIASTVGANPKPNQKGRSDSTPIFPF